MTTFPTIHINGTGKQDLLDGYTAAMRAVEAASKALQAVEFNARDYYPQGGFAWMQACEERADQYKKLREVKQHLAEIALHISNA
jgi:phosphoribosylformylglycinamidine (FGAM) synthase-like enzyme